MKAKWKEKLMDTRSRGQGLKKYFPILDVAAALQAGMAAL